MEFYRIFFTISFFWNRFLGVYGVWVKSNMVCSIVNIYSSSDLTVKKVMWHDIIISKKGFGGLVWCLVGDFNVVRCASERRGVTNSSQEQEHIEFNKFIDELNVIDLLVLGKRFTWFKSDGFTMSRIDRFLLSRVG